MCGGGGGGGGALGQISSVMWGSAAPGSEPLPYFRESRTLKTYPILGKFHNPGHPMWSGLKKYSLFYGNSKIPCTRSGPDSEIIHYFESGTPCMAIGGSDPSNEIAVGRYSTKRVTDGVFFFFFFFFGGGGGGGGGSIPA